MWRRLAKLTLTLQASTEFTGADSLSWSLWKLPAQALQLSAGRRSGGFSQLLYGEAYSTLGPAGGMGHIVDLEMNRFTKSSTSLSSQADTKMLLTQSNSSHA